MKNLFAFPLTALPLGFTVKNVNRVPELSQAAKLLGRRGGLAKSAKKAEAARKNGKTGGRPKKRKVA